MWDGLEPDKMRDSNTIFINLEIFDDYMEQFREPPTEMKHPLPNVNNYACKLRVCGTLKAGEYRQFQDGRGYRGIRGTASIRNQYCIGNGTYQVWFCGDSV